MCERTKIRNDITERLKNLKANVYSNPRPISYTDLPAVFVSYSGEYISLKAHPNLFARTLEITIQGFVTGNTNDEADDMLKRIEDLLAPTKLELQEISFEHDSLSENLVGSFIMNYKIEYEEQKE